MLYTHLIIAVLLFGVS